MIVAYFSAGLGVYYIGRKTKLISRELCSDGFMPFVFVLFWPPLVFIVGVVKGFEKAFKIIEEDTK
jgi:hypothetical protein